MHVTLIIAQSLDGRITNGDDLDISKWTSTEDKEFFQKYLEKSECIIVGRKTYELVKNSMKHIEGRLRIVLSRNPEEFAGESIPGLLEFSNLTPQELCKSLRDRGITKATLVTGGSINADFFNADCVDEIITTVEPYVFSCGLPMVTQLNNSISLKLESYEKVNEQGTLVLKYQVLHT